MTEAEWMAAKDPVPMLDVLRGKASDRKLRLFAGSCCRRMWGLLADPASRAAVEFSERLADGGAGSRRGFPDVRRAAKRAYVDAYSRWKQGAPAGQDDQSVAEYLAAYAVTGLQAPVQTHAVVVNLAHAARRWGRSRHEPESAYQAALLRDVTGNPFRPVVFDPAWRSPTVAALATRMYDSLDFSAMPVLGDALQDAGSKDAEVLRHCREDGVHVRGCWVVDLVLGKE